eukprot:6619208-Pyramimonas_sp.AAC.1
MALGCEARNLVGQGAAGVHPRRPETAPSLQGRAGRVAVCCVRHWHCILWSWQLWSWQPLSLDRS